MRAFYTFGIVLFMSGILFSCSTEKEADIIIFGPGPSSLGANPKESEPPEPEPKFGDIEDNSIEDVQVLFKKGPCSWFILYRGNGFHNVYACYCEAGSQASCGVGGR